MGRPPRASDSNEDAISGIHLWFPIGIQTWSQTPTLHHRVRQQVRVLSYARDGLVAHSKLEALSPICQSCPTQFHHGHICMRCSAISGPWARGGSLACFVGPMTTSNERIHRAGPGTSRLDRTFVHLSGCGGHPVAKNNNEINKCALTFWTFQGG